MELEGEARDVIELRAAVTGRCWQERTSTISDEARSQAYYEEQAGQFKTTEEVCGHSNMWKSDF